MYDMNTKNKKQKKEGLEEYAEVASIHGINYIFERNVVTFSRYENIRHRFLKFRQNKNWKLEKDEIDEIF